MTVLKDKAAINLYGQDAKDGVIVITLKKNANGEASDVFDVVEVMPQFPGGAPKLFEYLSQNIRYPKEAMEAEKQGRVIVTFVVGKDGSIRDARVVKSVDPLLDAEGLRVISTMPNWTPGMQSGKAVSVKYTVPITFRLDGKAKETPKAEGTFTPGDTIHATLHPIEDVAIKDFINKLPGAKIDENGNITINGKAVKKILLDGKAVKDLSKSINPKNIKLETDDLIIMSKEK